MRICRKQVEVENRRVAAGFGGRGSTWESWWKTRFGSVTLIVAAANHEPAEHCFSVKG